MILGVTKMTWWLCFTSTSPLILPQFIPVNSVRSVRQLCEKCKTVLSKSTKATAEGRVYRPSVQISEWLPHNPNGCPVCTVPVGGRPRKATKNRGRPTLNSTHTLITNIKQCSTPSLLPVSMRNRRPSYVLPPALGLAADDVECSICMMLLDQPVQLSCGSVVCMECVCRLVDTNFITLLAYYNTRPECRWVEEQNKESCPCCYSEHTLTAQKPSGVLLKVLGGLWWSAACVHSWSVAMSSRHT